MNDCCEWQERINAFRLLMQRQMIQEIRELNTKLFYALGEKEYNKLKWGEEAYEAT